MAPSPTGAGHPRQLRAPDRTVRGARGNPAAGRAFRADRRDQPGGLERAGRDRVAGSITGIATRRQRAGHRRPAGIRGAVRLFVERAALGWAASPSSDDEVQAVAAICRRLDGAGLWQSSSPPHASGFLIRRANTGTGSAIGSDCSPAAAPSSPRQRTLEATVNWSYDLLTDPERRAARAAVRLLGRM